MPTLIHVLSKIDGNITAVAYYPIPDDMYSDSSVDENRTGATDVLTDEEVAKLREGRIIEQFIKVDSSGLKLGQIQALLVREYKDGLADALSQYKAQYPGIVDSSWNGESWDHP